MHWKIFGWSRYNVQQIYFSLSQIEVFFCLPGCADNKFGGAALRVLSSWKGRRRRSTSTSTLPIALQSSNTKSELISLAIDVSYWMYSPFRALRRRWGEKPQKQYRSGSVNWNIEITSMKWTKIPISSLLFGSENWFGDAAGTSRTHDQAVWTFEHFILSKIDLTCKCAALIWVPSVQSFSEFIFCIWLSTRESQTTENALNMWAY